MQKKIDELTCIGSGCDVVFTYTSYCRHNYVHCEIRRPRKKDLIVRKTRDTAEEALDAAIELLGQVKEIEKHFISTSTPFPFPSLDKQTHVDGYYREVVKKDALGRDVQIEYKRTIDSYVITDIETIDGRFTVLKNPIPVGNDFKKVGNDVPYTLAEDAKNNMKLLADGEEMWYWDDIGFLSGSAGLAIVKNGFVIKKLCIAMS